MATVKVCETFTALQGESSFAGWPCFFIRLAGCNLRCAYCDTPQAYAPGADREVGELAAAWQRSRARIAEITGGEPLLQPGLPALAAALRDCSARPVLVETNGSCDISAIPAGVIAVVDVKCPGSGMSKAMDLENLGRLRRDDEVKFVIADRGDYVWARELIESRALAAGGRTVLLSPVWGVLEPRMLAEWILADGLPVRLQVQLHRVLGMR
jgi:7-carboxy-7-deazaguanine synthase